MFFCLNYFNGNYTILDTDDNVEEVVSHENLRKYLESGIEILGVTLDSLSIMDTTLVYVDFPSTVLREGRVFNGYYFESYNNDNYINTHNSYLHSLISVDNVDELLKYLPYIQEVNKSILFDIQNNMLFKFPIKYNIQCIIDDTVFNVRDVDTGDEYGFTYCDVCSSLVLDNKSTDGVLSIDKEKLILGDNIFYLENALKYELQDISLGISSNCICELNDKDSNIVDRLYLHTTDLGYFIKENEDKLLTTSRFPIVPLYDYCEDDKLPYSSDFNLHKMLSVDSKFICRKGNIFIFSDIELVDEDAINLYGAYKYSKPDFYNAVEEYIKFKNAKLKLMNGVEPTVKKPSFRFNDEYLGDSKVYKSVNGLISDDKYYYYCCETKFGSIFSNTFIRKTNNCSVSCFDGIEMFGLSRGNNYYYNIGRSGITIHTSSNSEFYPEALINSSFSKYVSTYRDDLGYYYNRPNIFPLFVHSVVEHEHGVEINILVAVNSNSGKSFIPITEVADLPDREKKKYGWGSLFFIVPLMLTGTRHYKDGDFVIFDLAFQELVVSKNIYNNLVVDIDRDNELICVDKCANISSAKECNCYFGKSTTKSALTIKKVLANQMKSFNTFISSRDYFE